MSADHDREDQRLRDILQGIRRGEDPNELDDELLHPKPQLRKKKRRLDEKSSS